MFVDVGAWHYSADGKRAFVLNDQVYPLNIPTTISVTPLAWDVARELSGVLHFDGETVVCWDHYGHGYDHSYCLAFSKA